MPYGSLEWNNDFTQTSRIPLFNLACSTPSIHPSGYVSKYKQGFLRYLFWHLTFYEVRKKGRAEDKVSRWSEPDI